MSDYHNVPGNFEDKYNTKNPIAKVLMNGFLRSFRDLLEMNVEVKTILEAGAGEGYLTKIVAEKYPSARIYAGDIEDEMNRIAKKDLASYKNVMIQKENVQDLSYKKETFDLVICCEVLEHVPEPEKALKSIHHVLKKGGNALLSVPHEPLWRVLNMIRGKYIKDFGNTPGHINHWASSSFASMVTKSGLHLIKSNHPLPWTMVLVTKE